MRMKYKTTDRQTKRIEERNIAITVKMRKLDVLCVYVCSSLSSVQLFVIRWTVAHQAPLSVEFSRQEYQSEQPIPSSGDLPDPGVKPKSPALQADSLPSKPPGSPRSAIQTGNFKAEYNGNKENHFTITNESIHEQKH